MRGGRRVDLSHINRQWDVCSSGHISQCYTAVVVVVVELPQTPENDLRSARAASGRQTG